MVGNGLLTKGDDMNNRMKKQNKGKFFSDFRETPCEMPDEPYNLQSFSQLLQNEISGCAAYSHQQIARWAWGFWWKCDEGELSDSARKDEQLALAADVALDIDAQWDLFLLDQYSMEELQTLDFSTVEMPRAWFENWLKKLQR